MCLKKINLESKTIPKSMHWLLWQGSYVAYLKAF